jgi:transcription antitermination protein NusB
MTAADNPTRPAPRQGGGRRGTSPRTAARVAAVQALYQIEMSGLPAEQVISEFRNHRPVVETDSEDGGTGARPDAKLFAAITAAASVRRGEIDELIKPALAEGWAIERLDAVMRAVLRAGVGELLDLPDVPARVAINEYVEVARAFLGAKETGFVNGVLDRLARRLRPDEVKSPKGESTP